MSDTFSNVDASSDPAAAIRWQERIDAWPQIRAYKARSYEWCGDQQPRLDIGSGPGTDAVMLGAFATDLSVVMCRAAAERGVTACRADVHELPYRAAMFGAVRADRVLQHVDDPARAVGEMVRVTASGGHVVASDPDQATLHIELPAAPPELVAKVTRARREIGYRHGTVAGRMPDLFAAAGLTQITTEPFPLELTNPDDAFGLPGWPRFWSERFTADEVATWERSVKIGREGGFVFRCSYVVTAGVRPLASSGGAGGTR